MPDLQIPQRQTFPAIRGSVSDEAGVMDLSSATLTLILNGPAGSPIILLPAEDITPFETFELNGQTFQANFEAPLLGADTAVATAIVYQAKLKMVWDAGPPVAQQFAPQVGFMEIEIVENLVEA